MWHFLSCNFLINLSAVGRLSEEPVHYLLSALHGGLLFLLALGSKRLLNRNHMSNKFIAVVVFQNCAFLSTQPPTSVLSLPLSFLNWIQKLVFQMAVVPSIPTWQ